MSRTPVARFTAKSASEIVGLPSPLVDNWLAALDRPTLERLRLSDLVGLALLRRLADDFGVDPAHKRPMVRALFEALETLSEAELTDDRAAIVGPTTASISTLTEVADAGRSESYVVLSLRPALADLRDQAFA
jgi:hypothetical protein